METIKNLIVDRLSCRYNDEWIFRDVSFSVKGGEVLAILGPSGSGKTTLAYCLTGIVPHKIRGFVNGDIKINGRSIKELSFQEILRSVNIVLQDYNLQIFGLTPEEDIIFSLENSGLHIKEIRNTLDKIITKFGLEKYRNTFVSNLSGGFRQRLSIASTIALRPDFLILDDPIANLDWRGIKSLTETIDELKNDGKGVVITASRLKGLENIIDKVIYLSNRRSGFKANSSVRERFSETNVNGEVIDVNSLWFKYNDDYVLKNINLKVSRGEILLLMGPNGSGKTTLVKQLNGLLKPSRGFVRILDKDTRKYSAAELAKHIGFVFQDPSRHITKETVWEEVIFGCKNLGLSECKAVESLKRLGLYDRRDYPPYKLSTGGKTRLSIACALAVDPDIIILDEPTTGQDESMLQILKDIILEMSYRNKAIIIITHDSDLALSVGTRLVVLLNGELVYDGKPESILSNPEKTEEYGIEPASGTNVSRCLENVESLD